MKVIKILTLIFVSLLAFILIAGLIIPKTYHVERTVSIAAPQNLIMDQVKSLKKMREWSPWSGLDPNQKMIYSGDDGHVGSKSNWSGNEKVGEGSQTITKITNDRVESQLNFIKPFKSHPTSFIQTSPQGEMVNVTWGMDGETEYPFNTMFLFMSMDKMVGKDYERGLKNLKTRCEAIHNSKEIEPLK